MEKNEERKKAGSLTQPTNCDGYKYHHKGTILSTRFAQDPILAMEIGGEIGEDEKRRSGGGIRVEGLHK